MSNPNTITPINIGAAWNPPVDPDSFDPVVGNEFRDPIEPGTNSPNITGKGWRLMVRRLRRPR